MTTIDMHSHIVPKGLADYLRQRQTSPYIRDEETGGGEYLCSRINPHAHLADGFDRIEKRLADMAKNNVDRAILSNQLQDISALPLEDSIALCRVYNDAISAECVARPEKFHAFAALPMGSVEAATAEFERAIALPGIIGAVIPGDAFLTAKRAERWAPLLAAADANSAILMAHYGRLPNDPEAPKPDTSDNRHLRMGTLDMQSRISSSMLTFCLTDLLAKYPNLVMMTHNLGGNVPFEVERMDHRTLVDMPQGTELPSKRIRAARVIVDCNSLGARSIETGVACYGAEKIVYGSDGTDFGMDWTNKALAEAKITDAERAAILGGNAERLIARTGRKFAQAAE